VAQRSYLWEDLVVSRPHRLLLVIVALAVTGVGLSACATTPPITIISGHPGMHSQTITAGSSTYTVYWRDTASTTRGGVMLVHGGGWTGGDRTRFTDPAIQLADAGYVAATIDYRLATTKTNPWPTQQQDALSAWRALRRNAATYHLNTHYLAIAGESAGGHIALATTEAMLPTERPSAVVSWSGPTDLQVWMTNPQPTCIGNECYYYNLTTSDIANDLIRCSYPACPTSYRAASPALHVFGLMPPTLETFFVRDIVPPAQGSRMNSALQAAGTSSTLRMYPDFGHGATWTPQVWHDSVTYLLPYMGPLAAAPIVTQQLNNTPVRRLPLSVTR